MSKKVIFHLNELAKWQTIIRNTQNLRDFYAERASFCTAEILANGEAVTALRKTETALGESLRALAADGVVVAACNNALRGYQLEKTDLFDFVTVVPAGVAELAEKQFAGYAYIKS